MDYLQEDYYPPPQPHDDSTPLPQTPLPSAQAQHPQQLQSAQQANSPLPTDLNDNDGGESGDLSYTSTADPSDPYNSMPPPPSPSTYPTLNDLMTACQTHARAHGYACVTSSNNYKRGIAYVRCDRGGHYANHWHLTPETRQRHNRTRRLVGCGWKARAKRLKSGEWELRMMIDRHSGHGPSGDAKAHPSLRKLDPAAISVARVMFEQGRAPKEVLEELRRWNEALTAQDVYNLKAKIAREDGNGGAGAGATPTADGKSGRKGGKRNSASGVPTAADGITSTGVNTANGFSSASNGNPAFPSSQVMGETDPSANAVLDPALQMQGIISSVGGPAPPAQMQDPTVLLSTGTGSNSNDPQVLPDSDANAVGPDGPIQPTKKGKCKCNCCDH